MTVTEFCMHHTQVGELVVIRCVGYIVGTVWVDTEDLFLISPVYAAKTIESDSWGTIPLTTEHGDRIEVPCHYIDV